jgi:competence protein ComEC
MLFLIGVLLAQQFSHLPNKFWVFSILPLMILLLFSPPRYRQYLKLFIMLAIGCAWGLGYAAYEFSWSIPENLEGKHVTVTGYIATIPNVSLYGTTFLFAATEFRANEKKQAIHSLLHLTWHRDANGLKVGDKWQLIVRLKKVHGTLNPGGFDYEAWAFQEGIRANGYVIEHVEQTKLPTPGYHYLLGSIRQYLKLKIAENLPVTHTSPWITALSIGERQGIPASDWEVLRNTGTNHLMAIAGLHIGFMAAFAHFIVVWLWRRMPYLTLKLPATHAGAVAALCIASIYSALAGFSIPTQRACIMLMLFLSSLLLRRKLAAWQVWSFALFVVLLLNPASVLTDSFWLSFGSVALIIYGVSGRLSPSGLWWKWGRIQWVIAVGLIPLSIGLFQQCSFVSFAANSIAIPWVGFLVVPLCLLGCFLFLFSASAGGAVLGLADKILSVLWAILEWFSHLPGMVWYHVIPHLWILIVAVTGIVLLLLPRGFPGRYLGVIGLLPLILYQPLAPPLGEMRLTILDVGQGLSAVVQTHKHTLVFDAGPRSGPGFDMGESVVMPFLRLTAAKQVDMLVISHGDNDHSGGAEAVLRQLPVLLLKTSVPALFPSHPATYCLQGEKWEWDGIQFEFLYPTQKMLGLNNDSSCVLRITAHDKHVLLTGDIEKSAERELVKNMKTHLAADILVAPHHGSKTSAVNEFLAAVHPHYVLFPIGYRNRYHFPHISVVEKYRAMGVGQYDTATGGAIALMLSGDNQLSSPVLYRVLHHHYWNS